MTSPVTYKTIKVSPETHKRVHDLAAKLGGSADDALDHLLGTSTVQVPVTAIQRRRWNEAADAQGMLLPEFVKMRVEAAITYGADPHGLTLIFEHVQALTKAAGILPIRATPPPRDTGGRPE